MDAKRGCWAAPGTLWTVAQLLWVPLTQPELRSTSFPPGDLLSSGSPVIYPAPGAGSDWIGLPIRSTQLFCRAHTCLAFSVSAILFGLRIITLGIQIESWESGRWLEPGGGNSMNRGTDCCTEHVWEQQTVHIGWRSVSQLWGLWTSKGPWRCYRGSWVLFMYYYNFSFILITTLKYGRHTHLGPSVWPFSI